MLVCGGSRRWHRHRHCHRHCHRLLTPSFQASICAGKPKPSNQGGLRVLEWTGSLVPQGVLVKGVKAGWRLAWQALVTELAPQDRLGTYQRPDYTFQQQIGGPGLPLEPGRYHLYVGNACPWCHRVLLALTLTGLEPFVGWVLSLAAQSGGRAHPATEACWQSCTR